MAADEDEDVDESHGDDDEGDEGMMLLSMLTMAVMMPFTVLVADTLHILVCRSTLVTITFKA